MEEIEKIREGLYIKKSLGEYTVVYPIRNEDKSINWRNLLIGGSWKSFIETLIIFFLILFSGYSYMHDTKECFKVLKNPCDYCNSIIQTKYTGLELGGFNYSLPLENQSFGTVP